MAAPARWLVAALAGHAAVLSTPAGAQGWIRAEVVGGRDGVSAAADTDRGRVIVFGGVDRSRGEWAAGTWEWNGRRWERIAADLEPPMRRDAAMAYDASRRVAVLFGGSGDAGLPLADTWEWDGVDWRLRAPATSPPPVTAHAMAYDAARRRVVMFGGFAMGANRAETWEWDGTDWTLRMPARSPPARSSHGMAYDAARRRVVMFGTLATGPETWEWDGTDWRQRLPTRSPTARTGHGMAYDPLRRRVVLDGGVSGTSPSTWEWDGTDWTGPAGNAGIPRRYHALAWDATRGQVVSVFGASANLYLPEVRAWDGSAWTVVGARAPSPASWHGMAYDSVRRRHVVLTAKGATWEWDGAAWHRPAVASGPVPRERPAMTFDPARQRTLLFGGRTTGNGPWLADTWEWDGSAWTRKTTTAGPSRRGGSAMTHAGHGRVMLFGGSASFSPLGDTWEWDGSTWRARTPSPSPRARSQHGIAYDPGRGVVVLYGGITGIPGSALGDTWEWDGTAWSRRCVDCPPGPARAPAMAYDPDRGRVVMFAGRAATDAWEWDGTRWTGIGLASGPPARTGHRVAYDTRFRRVVMFGGRLASSQDDTSELWSFGPTVAAAARGRGHGCGGAAGVPVLLPFGRPWRGNTGFALDLYAAGGVPAAVVLAPRPAEVPLGGGCTLLVDPGGSLAVPAATSPGGFATLRLAVPLSTRVLGAGFSAQAAALDGSGPWSGLSLTRALDATIGE